MMHGVLSKNRPDRMSPIMLSHAFEQMFRYVARMAVRIKKIK